MEYISFIIAIVILLLSFILVKYNNKDKPSIFITSPISFLLLILFLFGIKSCDKNNKTIDKEYLGSYAVSARYYEYWSTYVTKTCSEQYACGTDTKGNTKYCTRYYDCSYCDENREYYIKTDNIGNRYKISQQEYNTLKQKWKSNSIFIDMDRDIHKHFSCGKDGDAYEIKYNNDIYNVDAITNEHTYENRTQATNNIFKYKVITDDSAKKLNIYPYPLIKNTYQSTLLGFKNISNHTDSIIKLFDWLNASYGIKKQVRVYVLIFKNKSLITAYNQETYWKGGNKNELNICIGLDDNNKIEWIYPFSWTDQKQILVELREDISEMDSLDYNKLYTITSNNIDRFWERKEFKDYKYIKIPLSNTAMIWMIVIAIIFPVIAIVISFGEFKK